MIVYYQNLIAKIREEEIEKEKQIVEKMLRRHEKGEIK